MTSPLDFKARAGSALFTLGRVIPDIHSPRSIDKFVENVISAKLYESRNVTQKKITWCILKTNTEE